MPHGVSELYNDELATHVAYTQYTTETYIIYTYTPIHPIPLTMAKQNVPKKDTTVKPERKGVSCLHARLSCGADVA
jgi:hypothetical protein